MVSTLLVAYTDQALVVEFFRGQVYLSDEEFPSKKNRSTLEHYSKYIVTCFVAYYGCVVNLYYILTFFPFS